MPMFYLFISLSFLVLGSYHLFSGISYITAIHSLLVSLYFYVISFEMRGRPFSRKLYMLLIVLFLADGVMNMIYAQATLLSGIISFVFAYFSWRSYQRLEK